MSSDRKVVLITGAAQRIGEVIARKLHQHGFNIAIHYRNSKEKAESLANELNQARDNSAMCFQANLVDINTVKTLANNVTNKWGRLDALINNASSFYPTSPDTASEDDWHALIDSNLKGPFFLSQSLVPELKKTNGCIVNIVDIYSERPLKSHSIYSIAKAGVAMMTKSLALELAPDIRVNGISPGAILWPDEVATGQTVTDKEKEIALSRIAMKRLGDPADIAKAVTFLLEDAPYVTGQIITVDGGRTLSM